MSAALSEPGGASPCYALDIETDTATGGLDPSQSAIVSVAVAGPGLSHLATTLGLACVCERGGDTDVVVLDHSLASETQNLAALDSLLAAAPAGVLTTWNGSAFDLPFLQTRAGLRGVSLGLELWPDATLTPKYGPLAGHDGAYRARWAHHRHCDIASSYETFARDHSVSWSLKPVATALGYDPVVEDRAALHRVSTDDRIRYVASDAAITWHLAHRLRSDLGLD